MSQVENDELLSRSEHCEACELLRHSELSNTTDNEKLVPKHSCTSKFFQSEFHEGTSHFGQAWDDLENHDMFWNRPRRMRRSISCDCILCNEKFHQKSHNKQLVLGHHNYSEDNIHSKVKLYKRKTYMGLISHISQG